MKLDVNKIFPNNPSRFFGSRTIRIFTGFSTFNSPISRVSIGYVAIYSFVN
jgi:hypothetical protein